MEWGLTSRRDRLQAYFSSQSQYFFDFHKWPKLWQDMALLEHKGHRERYRLFLFFVFNGLNPKIAKNWVMAADAGSDVAHDEDLNEYMVEFTIPGKYDASAHRHFDQLVVAAGKPTGTQGSLYNTTGQVYSFHQKRVVYVKTGTLDIY